MADDFGGGLDMSAGAAPDASAPPMPPGAPQSGGFGSAIGGMFGPRYTPPDPNTSALDQSADLLQQRVKRANQIATNPLAQFFAPEQVQAARDFVPKATEQLQTIEKQKADIAAGRKQAEMLGLAPGEVSDQATREDRTTAAQQRALKGDLKAFQGLQAVDPKAAEAIQDQVHSTVAANLTRAQSAFDKLASARGQGEYTNALRELRQSGSISGLESLGLKVPYRLDQFNAAKGREAEALRNARIGVDTVRQKLEDRNTYQPMEKKEAETYNGRMTTAYGDQITNGTWSRNSAAGTRGLIVNGAADPRGLQKDFTLATPEQRKAIEEESEKSVPKDEREKSRNFNRTYQLATTDAKGNKLPDGQVNTNPNVQQGMAEALASMLRGGSGGANVGLLKIETNKRGFIQGLVDKISTEKAAAINELKGADVNPYLSKLTQGQIRDVMDVLKQYTDKSVGGRNEQIARRAGALGLDAAALGYAKGENAVIDTALEEGRQAQIARMTPQHQAIGGGDGVFQVGAQRPGAGATGTPQGTQAATQLPGAPPLQTPVQQAANPPPGPHGPAIASAASTYGVDPTSLAATVQVESGGNPRARTGSYKGLTQLSDSEFDKYNPYPGRSIWDPEANLAAGAAKMKAEGDQFAKNFGRQPSGFDTYMIHQQGLAGYSHYLANPAAPAWQNMAATGEGRQKGDRWSKAAIWDNVPDQYKATFGSVNNVSSADFMAMWQQRFARATKMAGGTEPAEPSPGNPPLTAAATDPRLAALRAGSRGARRDTPQDREDVQSGAVEHAPAIGSTIGALAGSAGGPAGAVLGGAAGGGAGQSLKDYLLGNAQSPGQIAKQAALGGVLGVAPEGRPVVGAAARALGAGAVEGGAKAAESGDAVDAGEAALTGAGAAAGGEAFGRALGMAGHKIYSLFTGIAQKTVRAAAADLHAANETLRTEPPKLPGAAGATTANPKYEAAEKAKEKAELTIKEMMPNAKPDEVAYAHKVESESVPRQEAQAARPGAGEKEAIGAGYRQLESDVGAAGRGAPKATPKLADGPIAAVENKQVSAKHAELAQRTETAITAPAKDWQSKWTQLKDVRSALLDAERDAMTSTAPGRTQTAKDMRALADTVRTQQEKAANYVFGPTKGAEVINKLRMLDTRYARLMKATNGNDLAAAARMKGEAGREADRAFRAFAHDDPAALSAWSAMRGTGPDVERDIRTMIGAERVPVLGHLVSAVKLVAGYNRWRAERAAGSAAKFEDFVPELKEAAARRGRAFRDIGGSAGARAAVSLTE